MPSRFSYIVAHIRIYLFSKGKIVSSPIVYIYPILPLCSPTEGLLCCLHLLLVVNNAAVDINCYECLKLYFEAECGGTHL